MIFYKYEGTGNDFIIVDNRKKMFPNNKRNELIKRLCHRQFGVGADGLILLQSKRNYDFEMVYYNSDGKKSTMCGNGGRCIVAFAKKLKIIKKHTKFHAIDGEHIASINSKNIVSLKMRDVTDIGINKEYCKLDTGSPHYVCFRKKIGKMNVDKEGKAIRNLKRYKKEGINVNFVEKINNILFVRTFERGVEAETLSCGTGVTAAVIAASAKGLLDQKFYSNVYTFGGVLNVKFKRKQENIFTDIYLIGPATCVYRGFIKL